MNKQVFKFFFFYIICTILLSACIKEKDYPKEPIIKFKSFTKFGTDSAHVVISFTDGDGDVGLAQGDTNGIFKSISPYYYNFYLRYLYKAADGTYKAFETAPGDTLDYKYRIPKLISDEQQKRALSGDIKVKLYAPYAIHDTIQYDIYIIDKALHKSNVVNSDVLILN